MKKIIIFLLIFGSISSSFSLIPEKKNFSNMIIGKWTGKTYKTIFNIPVYFYADFMENKLFKLKVKVLGFTYDKVFGNYKIDRKNSTLVMVGWRERTKSRKKLVFKILSFKLKKIDLALLADDAEIENSKKPIFFLRS
jgi:hypothetical protein